jgi:hypothetical protein
MAWHGMSYNIFLKSLRSLDKFRKNPHIKIPSQSPCINFQSPNIFKIQFVFSNDFSFKFQPNIHPTFWPRAAQQAEPAHQVMPPFPSSLPHLSRWLRHLLLSHRHAKAIALPFSRTIERPQRTPPSLTRSRALTRS